MYRKMSFGKQFLAFFIILSLIFTQVAPAYALRPAGLEGNVQSGLEAALATANPLSDGLEAAVVDQLPAEVAHTYQWWQASRGNPVAAARYYDANANVVGKSDCRVCAHAWRRKR